ncbi:redoxin domain-containing protein [Paraoerskovia marina]|uniref:redoxin domain-containing protein n=1 Tax=Paraoerskovia marina TaxID=545619 RepID=UPI000694F186|nr:redoxin domain-containing protein [Paraoerskovia marina]
MTLAVGDRVPPVVASDTSGEPVVLDGSEEPLVLVFVPYAFSPVCTGEVHALRELAGDVVQAGLRLFVVSCDSLPALRAWLEHEPYDGVSDFWPHGAVARAFGVFDEDRGAARRGSFLVADGEVRWAVRSDPGSARPTAAYRAMIDGWRGSTSP